MKSHRYCYHITNGVARAALQCGTVTAQSMEDAAEQVAKRAGLEKMEDPEMPGRFRWMKDGKKRNVYVLHDPKA